MCTNKCAQTEGHFQRLSRCMTGGAKNSFMPCYFQLISLCTFVGAHFLAEGFFGPWTENESRKFNSCDLNSTFIDSGTVGEPCD